MSKVRILHVDDDERNRAFLKRHLAAHDCQIEGVASGAAALKKLDGHRFDAIIIDLHMPVMDGFTLMEEIEARCLRKNSGKYFILSSDYALDSKERAFRHGIDDYLTYQMEPAEMVMRICSRIARSTIDEWNGLVLDPEGQGFIYSGELIHLTRIEYRLLTHLLRAAGATISRDELREKAWPGEMVLDQTLNTHVSNLRSKIRPHGFDVRALRNKGFKLVE